MTFFRKFSATAILVLAMSGVAVVAQDAFTAPATPEEAIRLRQNIMTSNGGLLRSASRLSGAEAVTAAQTLLDSYTHLLVLFPEGSQAGSDSLPAIWENWDAFAAILETGRGAAASALAAAQAGDDAGYAAGLRTIMGTCGQCHQQFRS